MTKQDLENRITRLAIEVTNVCNSNCRFCAYRYMKRPKQILSTKDFEVLLGKYVEYGGGELKFTPIVGDPLTDKDFVEKIRLASNYDEIKHIYTYTNLVGLKNVDTTDLLLSGINKIDISTCIGSKRMYKRLYGTNNYELVMENIKSIITINNLLSRPVNIEIILRADKPYDKIFKSKDYKKIAGLLGKEPRVIENYDNWTGLIKKKDLPKGQEFRVVDNMSEPCSLFYKGVIVFANGDVGLCWCRDIEATLIIGNLYKNTLDEIWRGEAVNKLRENWYKGIIPNVCKNCYQYTPLSEILK